MIWLDETRPNEGLAAAWKAYEERLPGLKDAFYRAATSWKAIAVCADREVIGGLLVKDGMVHLGIVEEWRGKWASRRVIRKMLEHGIRTELMEWESPSFIERVGFRKQGNYYEFHR